MKFMQKGLIVSGLVAALLAFDQAIVSASQETSPIAQAETEPEVLTLEKAVQYALAANADLKVARLDADNADYHLRLASMAVRDIHVDDDPTLEMAQLKHIPTGTAEMEKTLQNLTVRETEDDVEDTATSYFFDFVNACAEQELNRLRLERMGDLLTIANAARKTQDVLQAKARIASLQAARKDAESKVDEAKTILNHYLGVDLDKEWKVQVDDLEDAKLPMTLQEAIDLATTQSIKVLQAQAKLKYAMLDRDLVERYSALSTFEGIIRKNDVEKAEISMEWAKKEERENMIFAFRKFEQLKELVTSYEEAKNAAAEYFAVQKMRYEKGEETLAVVLQAEEALCKQEDLYQKARNDFISFQA